MSENGNAPAETPRPLEVLTRHYADGTYVVCLENPVEREASDPHRGVICMTPIGAIEMGIELARHAFALVQRLAKAHTSEPAPAEGSSPAPTPIRPNVKLWTPGDAT